MKSKILALSILSVFIVAAFAVLTSANIVFTEVIGNDVGVNQGDTATVSFKLFEDTNLGGDALDIDFNVPITMTSGVNTFNSDLTVTGAITNLSTDATSIEMSLDFVVPANQATGTYTGTIQPTGTYSADFEPLTVTLTVFNAFCSAGSKDHANLKLKVDINNRGEGDDDDWMPLDLIEIEVELENNRDLDGDGDLDDILFELGLFKKGSSSNIMDEMMWISEDDEEVEVGDVDENEDEKWLFEFRVDPREVDEDNYILKVKAFPDGDESETCLGESEDLTDFGSSDSFADIQVSKENDEEKMVVIDKKSYSLVTNAFCSEQVSLSVDVYNIGDKDFEDQIKVTLSNKELGINEEEISSGDFDEGDKSQVTFSFEVPKDAQEKTYTLLMETFYDYDKDDDQYDEISEDTFTALLKVEGSCTAVSANALVTAILESGGDAGEKLVVRATITNNEDEAKVFTINAAGFSQWASSFITDRNSLSLGAGESANVLFTFNVNDDASGSQSFTIELVSEDNEVITQPVSVSIEEAKSGFLTGSFLGVKNGYLFGIAILNLVLVLAIIIVAIRVMRR